MDEIARRLIEKRRGEFLVRPAFPRTIDGKKLKESRLKGYRIDITGINHPNGTVASIVEVVFYLHAHVMENLMVGVEIYVFITVNDVLISLIVREMIDRFGADRGDDIVFLNVIGHETEKIVIVGSA